MADVNWGLAANANNFDFTPEITYADKIMRAREADHVRKDAGQKYSAGDVRGAAKVLAESGDLETAAALAGQQDKLDQSHYEFTGRAANLLNQVYDQQLRAGKTPEEATAAVMQGYDTIASQLPAAFGTPEQMAQFRQRLASDPKGTLTAVSGLVQQKLTFQKDGQGRIIALNENTGEQVGKPIGDPQIKAPQSRTRISGDQTIEEQFNDKTGQWETLSTGPRYKPTDGGTAARMDARAARQDAQLGIQYRKEFNGLPEVKDFNDVANSYEVISDLAKRPGTAQDDIASIFAFMKTLDPGSVVREGEFATAQNAAGIPDRIQNLYNNALRGDRLNPTQRKELANTVGSVYRSRKKRYDQLVEQYRGYVSGSGLPEDVIQARLPASAEASRAPSGPKVGAIEDGYRFKGGDPKNPKSWEKVR